MTDELDSDPILRDVPELEGYKILEPCVLYAKVGQGGFGAVYRGKHVNFDIDVGVKCLLPRLTHGDEQVVLRFEREARLAARITHPNLVRVFDVNQRHGLHYLVMEYVRGETARERVGRKGPLPVGEAVMIVLGAARGVAAAHAQQIVHRDIKPDNVLISAAGEVKLADLGLGRIRDGAEEGDGLTVSDIVMGTPRYMPPEQWDRFGSVGPPGDVWALGATLYFLLAGMDAFGGARTGIMQRVCTEAFPDIREKVPDFPPDLVEVLQRCTERASDERYPDALELVESLEAVVAAHGLKGSLSDSGVETGKGRCGVVSPPPRELLAKIKLHRQDAQRSSGQDDSDPGDGGTVTMPVPSGEPKEPPRSRWPLRVAVFLGVMVLGGASWLAFEKSFPPEAAALGPTGKKPGPSPPPPLRDSERSAELFALAAEKLQRPDKLDECIADLREVLRLDAAHEQARDKLAIALRNQARRLTEERSFEKAYEALHESLILKDDPLTRALLEPVEMAVSGAVSEVLDIDAPKEGAVLDSSSFYVSGNLQYTGSLSWQVRVNGKPSDVAGGQFDALLSGLPDGRQTITVEAREDRGLTVTESVQVVVDTAAPELVVDSPTADAWVRPPCRIAGSVSDTTQAEVRVNGSKAKCRGDRWEVSLDLADGRSTVSVEAVDETGRRSTASRSFLVDSRKPVLTVLDTQAEGKFLTNRRDLQVRVRAEDKGELNEVLINDAPASFLRDAVYSRLVPLANEGTHAVRIDAVDRAGNRASTRVDVICDRTPPELSFSLSPELTRKIPAGPLTVTGTARDAHGLEAVTVNGTRAELRGDEWTATIPVSSSTKELRIEAIDSAGNTAGPVVHPLAVMSTETLAARGFELVGANEQGYEEFRHRPTGIVMVLLPGGTFWMGRKEPSEYFLDEQPRHQVTLDAFLIAKYEVSQAEWKRVMKSNPSQRKADNLPVDTVSWNDCQEFCARTGLSLPTEAQWEYACRAGTETVFAFGDTVTPAQINSEFWSLFQDVGIEGSRFLSLPVSSMQPNAFGLHHMHGNLREWCQDVYDEEFYKKPESTQRNPVCTSGSENRVLRGGSTREKSYEAASAARDSYSPESSSQLWPEGLRPTFQLRSKP